MDKSNTFFDIVISGGGLVGCLAALSLSTGKKANGEPLRIAIIETNEHEGHVSKSFDDRVLALSHRSVSFLKRFNAWQFIAEQATAIKTIHISDQSYYGKARIYAKDYQVSALGHVIEMALLGKGLLKSLMNKANVTWFKPDSISAIEWETSQVNIQLTSGRFIHAALLLGCDGAQSVCRRLANIEIEESCYQQSALITNITTQYPHKNKAFERFTETGPIAVLPLSSINNEARCSVVWTLTPEMAQASKSKSPDELKTHLEASFGHWLGKIIHMGKCDIYPLKLLYSKEQVYHRMVLLGNASHTIHPIAGQGFNLGVRDVEALSISIQRVLNKGQDIGQLAHLMTYAQKRKIDHQETIALTDSLVTLFSNQHTPLVLGRNIGLKMLNYFKPIKNALVKKTMGY